MSGIPGRLRRQVAEILSDHFGRYVDPTNVRPAQGHYRTSPYADCFRWEYSETSIGWFGCWVTMTDFVRDVRRFGGMTVEDGEIRPAYPRRCNSQGEAM